MGEPVSIDGVRVRLVELGWTVTDRWWTDKPIVQEFWCCLLENGTLFTVVKGDGVWTGAYGGSAEARGKAALKVEEKLET